jgi:hypothetical protein
MPPCPAEEQYVQRRTDHSHVRRKFMDPFAEPIQDAAVAHRLLKHGVRNLLFDLDLAFREAHPVFEFINDRHHGPLPMIRPLTPRRAGQMAAWLNRKWRRTASRAHDPPPISSTNSP